MSKLIHASTNALALRKGAGLADGLPGAERLVLMCRLSYSCTAASSPDATGSTCAATYCSSGQPCGPTWRHQCHAGADDRPGAGCAYGYILDLSLHQTAMHCVRVLNFNELAKAGVIRPQHQPRS